MSSPHPLVICFGEVLWDILPTGEFPGGAPMNAAFHLRQLGLDSRIISAVGVDARGDELLKKFAGWGMDAGEVTRHRDKPTGFVNAILGSGGDVRYNIALDVAWDDIVVEERTLQLAAAGRAIVFGSLAQRSAQNRASLERLLAAVPADAERVFDVNLRPPHDDLERVRELAKRTTLLKLNTAEAARLAGAQTEVPGSEESLARRLAEVYNCRAICITAAERGAGLLHGESWFWEPGRPVKVEDPVGAGDAFLAALLAARLRGMEPAACLARACRLGEWVASQSGATPDHGRAGDAIVT